MSKIDLPDRPTLARLLIKQAGVGADRPAVAYPDEQLTFGELLERSQALARALLANGVSPGARVGVFLPNCLEYIELVFAASLIGAQLVPINARFKRNELAYVIAQSAVTVVFTTSDAADHVDFPGLVLDALPGLREADSGEALQLEQAPSLRRVVIIGATPRAPMMALSDFLASGAAVTESAVQIAERGCDSDDVAVVLYTSGTAAAPKGCELTHHALISAWCAFAEAIDLAADTPLWAPCPMFHVGGIGPLTSTVAVGAKFISASRYDAALALEQLLDEGAVHLFPAFPAFTLGLVRTPAYSPERLSAVRTVLNVAPPETEELIQSLLPANAVLINDFGMTEGAGIITFTPVSDPPRLRFHTNGRPFPGLELRITADDGHTVLDAGEPGEIQFRGPNALKGYLNDPVTTTATIVDGGWIRTGDRGRLEPTGHLVYIGRIKEMLKVGGENVAPAEVEALLSTHPAVAMAQIVGRPDDRYGEVPVAFVELMPGAAVTEEELIDFCRGQVANFKLPREVRFVEQWPMSATKIQKFRLREMLAAT
jgi:fatty-acyl-CoA synthase